jgi:CheY-specific phosphatase CheX
MSGAMAPEGLVEPFVAATRVSLEEMADVDVVVRSVTRGHAPVAAGDIVASIELTWGRLRVCAPRTTAQALARRILEGVADEPDGALVPDCMGEIANVIAGQAKTLLAETPYAFSFSVPRVQTDPPSDHPDRPNTEHYVIALGGVMGDMMIELQSIGDWGRAPIRP